MRSYERLRQSTTNIAYSPSLVRQWNLLERPHEIQQLHFCIFAQLRAVSVAGVAVASLRCVKLVDTKLVPFVHITKMHDLDLRLPTKILLDLCDAFGYLAGGAKDADDFER